MTYKETLDWMFGQLPMYQQKGKAAFNAKLDKTISFSKYLDNPEKKFKSIHVAGTNGKGSSSHMLASILQEAGYKTGLYTSPHLKDFRERIKINGEPVDPNFVIDFIRQHKAYLESKQLSFFEMTVGMAFDFFAKEQVDIAIIEVGLGGRLDSTNIIFPEVSLITNIGYDHVAVLGDTLEKIAVEKAGIIKKNVPVVIGEYHEETFPVFTERAKEDESKLYLAEETIIKKYKIGLLGDYQQKNYKAAVQAVQLLKDFKITDEHIKNGLLNVVANTNLKGRWQILNQSPKTICDTAHNKEGIELVMEQLQKEDFKQLHIVFGVVKDKKLEDILLLLPKSATYYFCCPKIIRGLAATELQKKAAEQELIGDVYNSVSEAYQKANENASAEDVIYIGGSTFVVAEIV